MEKGAILQKLLEMVRRRAEFKKINPSAIGYDVNLAQIGFDSLDFSEMIVDVEEEFDCVVRMDDMLKLQTTNDFADFIAAETES